MRKHSAGFTLMEMIGVVAVIAILASMATPMIFDAMRNARVTAFLEDVNVARTAVARFYEDTGDFPSHISTSSNANDRQLMANTSSGIGGWNGPYIETELQNPFSSGAYAAILNTADANYQFDLDGDGAVDTTRVSVFRIDATTAEEARRISDILDSDGDIDTGDEAWYAAGRVKLFAGRQSDDTVLIFLSRE